MREILIDSEQMFLSIELKSLLQNAVVFDCSSSETSRTYKILKNDEVFFCKIGSESLLSREVRMNRFFHEFGLGPQVIHYYFHNNQGFLVTESLDGTDGISIENLHSPEQLADSFGQALVKIHSLPPDHCPFPHRTEEMIDQVKLNFQKGFYAEYLIPEGFLHGKRKFEDLLRLSTTDSVIHGDYCLPNIIFKNSALSGFIDLGTGGFGDSHYDLFWGLWTLKHNFKTEKYNDIFLNAYGRNRIDFDRLELNRLISGFTE